MNKLIRGSFIAMAVSLVCGTPQSIAGLVVVDFEGFDLSGEADGYLSGPAPNAVTVPAPNGAYGLADQVGTYDSNGVRFQNVVNGFGSNSGFGVSKTTDSTTPGFLNASSAITGGGAGASSQYAVAFGYHEQAGSPFHPYFAGTPFDSTNVAHLLHLPTLFLPAGATPVSTLITNTTYAALSMAMGDGFTKKFGGPTGDDPDFFKLSVFGIDDMGQAMGTEIEFFLADYRFADQSQDDIVDTWELLDLSPLAGARSLHFNLDSSDVGAFGMNTPGYFAMDDFTYSTAAVPEPSSLILIAATGLVLLIMKWRSRILRNRTADA